MVVIDDCSDIWPPDPLPIPICYGRYDHLMGETELLSLISQTVEDLPGAELVYPFGPQWDVYKVHGLIFLLLTRLDGVVLLTVKAEPDDARALCQLYASIVPGYHMNKRHWISIRPGPGLPPGLITELIIDSYLLVVEKLPRARRPVNPYRWQTSEADDLRPPAGGWPVAGTSQCFR